MKSNDLFSATTLDVPAPPELPADALRDPPSRLTDAGRLGLLGGALIVLALGFLWADQQLAPAYLIALVAAAGCAASAAPRPRAVAALGLLALLLCAVGGGAWYLLEREPALLPGLLLALVGGVANAALAYPRARARGDRRRAAQLLCVLCATVLCGSWALYFQLLTLGVDSLARRLVLTLLWMGLGAGLVARGARRRDAALRWAGYVFTCAALGKAVLYDTTHLHGGLRVLCLGAAGLLLLGGAVLSRSPAAPAGARG